MTGRLIIICGLPGSGKTTLARQLEAERAAVRLSADDWLVSLGMDLWDEPMRARCEALQGELAQRLLRLDQTVVVEWGTWLRAERDGLRDAARAVGAAVELRYLTAPLDVLWERVRRRDLEQRRGSRAMTLDDLTRYLDELEPPDAAELASYDEPAQ